jgi:hypothetical protein
MDVNGSENERESSSSRKSAREYAKCDRKHVESDDDSEHEYAHKAAPKSKLSTSIYEYLVLISIILIIFAAFRNSVTWWVIFTAAALF